MAGFSIPLARLAAMAKLDLDTVVKKSTFDLFAAVVEKTPILSGQFRANWNCSQGEIDATTTDSTSASRADAEAKKALSFKPGGVVYFVNGLPYGYRLEYEGWSKVKAPSGMLRVSIAEFDGYLKKAISA